VVAAGAFAGELALRPMLEDIARFLPDDFSPTARSWRLRARALAPLPIVTLFSALIAGAYVDLVARGPDRYLVALGIGLVIVALASVIFWVVTRSLLEPVDELLAATRRVSQGDITTPVPVVTADELGALAAGFNQMLANLRQHERELRESRARIVTAADHARQRVERDLHDGAQQSLVLLNLKLAMTQRLILNDPNQAERNLDEARHDLERALAELRDLAHGIYPAMLENEGLQSALHEAAERSAIPTTIDCNGANRYPPEIESAVYFCCLEALQNAAKHAGPGARATLRLTENAGSLQFEVTDNGHGFDPTAAITSSGIHNMSDRIGALGGNLTVHSAPGRGTAIAGTIPFDGS
jgi:signal transduction histidine kinase